MPGRLDRPKLQPAEGEPVTVGQRPDAGLGNRQDRPPQAVHLRAVDPRRAGQQAGRVHQMLRPEAVHVHRAARRGRGHVPGRAGVVEVDVRQQQVPHVAEARAQGRESGFEHRQRAGRPALDDRQALVGLQDVGGDGPGLAEVFQIDQVQAWHGVDPRWPARRPAPTSPPPRTQARRRANSAAGRQWCRKRSAGGRVLRRSARRPSRPPCGRSRCGRDRTA